MMNRLNIKLIVSDIDGTLLTNGKPVSRANIDAIAACRARGVEFVVASGRWYPSALNVARQLGIQDGYMITCNGGAVVKCDGSALMERGLSAAGQNGVSNPPKGKGDDDQLCARRHLSYAQPVFKRLSSAGAGRFLLRRKI